MSYDYWQRINYGDIKNREIQINIVYNEDKGFTKNDLQKCLNSIDADTLNKVTQIYAEAYDNNENLLLTDVFFSDEEKGIYNEYLGSYNVLPFYFTYINGKFRSSDSAKKTFSDYNVLDEQDFLTDVQYENSERVALVDTTLNNYYKDKDSILLLGQEFKIIGSFKNSSTMNTIIPFTAIPNETELKNALFFDFDETVTMDEYRDIVTIFEQNYSDVTSPIPLDSSVSNRDFYISVLASIAVIILISAVNFWIINKNLLSKNIKKYTIYRICGARKFTIIKRYILLSFVSTLLSVIAGYLIYSLILENNVLKKYYKYIYPDQNRMLAIITIAFMLVNIIYSFVICQLKMNKYPMQKNTGC